MALKKITNPTTTRPKQQIAAKGYGTLTNKKTGRSISGFFPGVAGNPSNSARSIAKKSSGSSSRKTYGSASTSRDSATKSKKLW